jgi:hypothetical protein
MVRNGSTETVKIRSNSHQPAIFLSVGVHSEALQHRCGGSKSDCLTRLPNRQSRQKYRHQTVLPEEHSERRMVRDLNQEPAVPLS